METTRKFKQLAVQITLKSMDKGERDWITFNDKIHTKIIGDDYFGSDIMLLVNELPIMECDLKNSYFLITTDRIISVIDGYYDEVFFIEMNNVSNEYNAENFKQINGEYPKTNIIAVKKNDNTTLIAKIDSTVDFEFSSSNQSGFRFDLALTKSSIFSASESDS